MIGVIIRRKNDVREFFSFSACTEETLCEDTTRRQLYYKPRRKFLPEIIASLFNQCYFLLL
jgi:hypothetical protein